MARSPNWLGSRSDLELMDASEDAAPPEPPKAPRSPIKLIKEPISKANRRRIMINMPPPVIPKDAQSGTKTDSKLDSNDTAKPVLEKTHIEPASVGSSNKVRTSKYTMLSFLPKNLFEQFRSIANFYFMSLVILQAFPPFALVSTLLTAAPILIIVCATAVKDAIEDWRRHQSDERVNHAKTYLLANLRNWNFPPIGEGILASKKKRLTRQPSDLISVLQADQYAAKNPTSTTILGSPPSRSSVFRSSVASSAFGGAGESRRFKDEGPFWQQNNWEDVRVGDFVYLLNNESIPADVMIVSTSEPDGQCYVETKNLDGETNLKIRRGFPEFAHVQTAQDCELIQGHMDSELPSANLFTYNGVMKVNKAVLMQQPQKVRKDKSASTKTLSIGMNSMLLRGCILRNTKWVIALVIYTGAETKIMLNSGITPSKRSKIDRQLNPLVILNFWLLGAMCIICSLICAVYTSSFIHESALFSPNGLEGQYTPLYAAFVAFFSCLIIFQNIVPISLYISVDVSKTVQSLFISMDQDLYDAESDKFVSPRSWNLSDDLGQIEYIFSDKTGTLTCNMMEFRKCSINGVVYGGSFATEAAPRGEEAAAAETRKLAEAKMRAQLGDMFDCKYLAKNLSFVDTTLPVHLKEGGEQGRKIREFFSLLAVCHTVLLEKPEADVNPNHIEYRAQSPDEAALVAAARDVGFAFLTRNDDVASIDLMGEIRTYKILNVLEFNSDRKRMSVIIKRPEGQIVLLTKGADSVIYDRLCRTDNLQDIAIREVTLKHLESFANEGLRTLCLACKVLPSYEYEAWAEKYRNAQNSLQDREKNVDQVADLIERDLTLVGATAIEDRLQDGVPETIGTLVKAGIKIWVLTGDKMETAINIGFASNLLKRNMVLIVINSTSLKDTFVQLLEALEKFWSPNGTPQRGSQKFSLVIDGTSLKFALTATCRPLLLEIGCRCQAVICCRVSPLQKARVVSLVRKGLGAMCLAIGDGANDVSMIQEADIGIGISGKEGMQAVMASDYAIAQFRFLQKLLLVHGRWGYVRTAEIIFNYFYKNAVWLFLLLWYQFDCGFSADLITDFTYGMFFNTLFTLFPTMFIGFYEQDINCDISMQVPQIYRKGMKQTVFTIERYWIYMFDALWQSIIAYYFIVCLYNDSTPNWSGRSGDHDSMGAIMSYTCIIAVNIHAVVNTTNWTYLTFSGLTASYAVWIGYVIFYSTSNFQSPPYGQLETLYLEPHFYLSIIISVVVCLMPRFVFKYAQQYLRPSDSDILLEIQKYSWKHGQHIDIGGEPHLDEHLLGRSVLENVVVPPILSQVDQSQLKSVNSDVAIKSCIRESSQRASLLKRTQSEHSVVSMSQRAGISPNGQSVLVTDETTRQLLAKHHFHTNAIQDGKGKMTRRSTAGLESYKIKCPDGFVPIPVRRPKSETNLPYTSEWKTICDMQESHHVPALPSTSVTPLPTRLKKFGAKTSIFFMGTQEEIPNTGFCFSHEEGMMDMITPTKASKFDLDSTPATAVKQRPAPISRRSMPVSTNDSSTTTSPPSVPALPPVGSPKRIMLNRTQSYSPQK
ncbi:hypothetical protein HDU98_011079 [Podochytrium sp. JEL0797]|nr:hypothetical protein HDU98_011079 [Podochytrium sp. JEL0797]